MTVPITEYIIADLAQTVSERLIGQCVISMDQALEDELEKLKLSVDDVKAKDIEIHQAIDMKVFCCDGCGWYCDTEELNNDTGENLCDDCNGDGTDDLDV